MTSYISGKLQANAYGKHTTYVLCKNKFDSFHSIAYGYIEYGSTAYLTFIKQL